MYLLATSLVKKFLILPRLLSNNGKRLFEYFSSSTMAEVPLQNRRLFRLKHCQIQLRKRQLEIWNKNSIINLKVPNIFSWNRNIFANYIYLEYWQNFLPWLRPFWICTICIFARDSFCWICNQDEVLKILHTTILLKMQELQ